jgi:nitrate reductase cytochrome c-type subunit
MLEQISAWLAAHSLAVQAAAAIVTVLLTAALAATTIVYARITRGILNESRLTRAAQEKQAETTQASLDFLKQQYEEQRGLGPHKVREAILDTKALIILWTERGTEARTGQDREQP